VARAALRAALVTTTLLAPTAYAGTAQRDVHLSIEDCTPSALDLREASAAAALELGLADADATNAGESGRVELDAAVLCDHGVKVRLTLRTADQSATRTIPLDDVRVKDRSRVLALSLAELVRAEWRWVTTGKSEEKEAPPGDERHVTPEDTKKAEPDRSEPNAAKSHADEANAGSSALAVTTPREPDRASEPAASPHPERGLSLEVLGHARLLFDGVSFADGASVGARWRRFSAGAEALFGRTRARLGTATFGSADAHLGYELLSATPGHWLFSLEPGLAAGVTWVTGTRAAADVQVSNTAGFYGDARLALRAEYLSAPLCPTLSFEGGRALGLAAQEERRTIAVTGGWFAGAAFGFVLRAR